MSFLLGIDFDNVYMISEAAKSETDNSGFIVTKTVQPAFPISHIANFELRGKRIILTVVEPRTKEADEFNLESVDARQIYSKLDIIINKLKKPVPYLY